MAKEVKYIFLYELIYDKLYEFSDNSKEIDITSSKKSVAHAYNIPYCIWNVILKEMELQQWIERPSRDVIKLIKKPINVLDNTSAIYKSVGLW